MVRSIKISSDIRKIGIVETFLNTLLKDFGISRKIYCKMYLATTEGVNNAILHGNKSDLSKNVKIAFEDKSTYFRIQISDEGVGFNLSEVADPREKNNLLKESGRGIFIMKQYADKVKFGKNGSMVQLIFNK